LSRVADAWIAVAAALAIVALTIPLFLNPVWVVFEQDRAQAAAWTGFAPADLRAATDAILADLVVGPPDFDVAVDGAPVLNERERGHMRDVRGVFIGFFAVALALAAVALVIAARRRGDARRASLRAVRAGAVGLALTLVLAGVVALVAFDALFETFHRLFFAGGTYTFDPATERLVQLFPFQFWQETAIALGAVAVVLAVVVAAGAGRRLSLPGCRRRSAGWPPSGSRARSPCRRGTTRRWMAMRSGPRIRPTRRRTRPSPSRSSGRSVPGKHPTRASATGPRSASRPARPCHPARTR
jgi:integral membrane protein (TIGR01906 family)